MKFYSNVLAITLIASAGALARGCVKMSDITTDVIKEVPAGPAIRSGAKVLSKDRDEN